jgi:DNA-binding transcriptional regulator GbsR (MarR family)
MKRIPKQSIDGKSHFIEQMGLLVEYLHLPRMAGRVWGLLMISNELYYSAEELAKELKASRGSISATTHLLMHYGMIERIAIPGERKDYFRLKSVALLDFIGPRSSWIMEFRKLIAKGLESIPSNENLASERLEELDDFYAFIEREMPLLQKRWDEEKKKREDII